MKLWTVSRRLASFTSRITEFLTRWSRMSIRRFVLPPRDNLRIWICIVMVERILLQITVRSQVKARMGGPSFQSRLCSDRKGTCNSIQRPRWNCRNAIEGTGLQGDHGNRSRLGSCLEEPMASRTRLPWLQGYNAQVLPGWRNSLQQRNQFDLSLFSYRRVMSFMYQSWAR